MVNDEISHHYAKRERNENSGGYPPLKINKDSHIIKKPPSPSSSSAAGLATAAAVTKPRPVIIYTHSPKVIHTNPKDFMALVQSLTGMSRSEEDSGSEQRGKLTNQTVSDPIVERKSNTFSNNNSRNRCHSYQRSYSGSGSGSGSGNGNGKGIFFNNPMISEDSESSSVITTDENIGEHGQVNSSLPFATVATPLPPLLPPLTPPPSSMFDSSSGINYSAYLPTFPIFPTVKNSPSDHSFLCANQPFANFDDPLFFAPNMRNSFSSSSSSGFDGLADFRDF